MTSPQHPASRWKSAYHAPVLVQEVLALLRDCTRVLDGTLGGGGHSEALLEQGVHVTGVDRDPEAITAATSRLREHAERGRFRAVQANYADLDAEPSLAGERFDGVLLDLGISSSQIDDDRRGFSFRPGAALDMRMESDGERTGADVLAESTERELSTIFRELADEPRAGRLAREIVRRRQRRPLLTSDDLVDAIRGALGSRSGPPDFARIFQAVRIVVNDELGSLRRALPLLRDRLGDGGVFAVIAYHSGEDGMVKHTFREWSAACTCPPRQPVCTCRGRSLGKVLTRKPLMASASEIAANPRARSARLRAWLRVG
jgi:16S rRNA (cytosine1402-N4)-methyltransferase